MDIIQVTDKMQEFIATIQTHCSKLNEAGNAEAEADRDYDKGLAIAILKLQADGNAVSTQEKLAKGDCSELKFNRTVAERGYKSTVTKIHAAESCLNALQSIFRKMENM